MTMEPEWKGDNMPRTLAVYDAFKAESRRHKLPMSGETDYVGISASPKPNVFACSAPHGGGSNITKGDVGEMNFKEAKEMSIKKWEYMVENPLDPMGEAYENCGLCRMYLDNEEVCGCGPCPLKDGAVGCAIEWKKWTHHIENDNTRWAKYWAQKLLDRIKAIEEPK